jgi:hypothetical protein
MMMLRGKFLTNRGTAIIENGTVHLFDLGGRYVGIDDCMNKHLSGLQNFSYISILSSKGGVDIALFEKDTMKRYSCDSDASQIAMRVQLNGGLLRILNKPEKEHNQIIFLYKEGTDLLQKLNGLVLKEAK